MNILLATALAILNAAGVQTASIHSDVQTRSIQIGAQTYTATLHKTGKWKWPSFETKPEPEGFKLRKLDGSLLWKIKMKPAKIEISDNQEGTNAFELRADRVVAPGGRVLGSVTKSEVRDASGKVVYRINGGPPCACYGVLLIDRIPELQRYIILTQLLGAGK